MTREMYYITWITTRIQCILLDFNSLLFKNLPLPHNCHLFTVNYFYYFKLLSSRFWIIYSYRHQRLRIELIDQSDLLYWVNLDNKFQDRIGSQFQYSHKYVLITARIQCSILDFNLLFFKIYHYHMNVIYFTVNYFYYFKLLSGPF